MKGKKVNVALNMTRNEEKDRLEKIKLSNSLETGHSLAPGKLKSVQ